MKKLFFISSGTGRFFSSARKTRGRVLNESFSEFYWIFSGIFIESFPEFYWIFSGIFIESFPEFYWIFSGIL